MGGIETPNIGCARSGIGLGAGDACADEIGADVGDGDVDWFTRRTRWAALADDVLAGAELRDTGVARARDALLAPERELKLTLSGDTPRDADAV